MLYSLITLNKYMQGKLITAVWLHNKHFYIGVVMFIDKKKHMIWHKKANIARNNKIDALKDAKEIRDNIISI